MAIIPLVFASLAVGVTRLGGTANVGRVGLKTIAYFLVTTACAAVIGLTLVNAIRPGDSCRAEQKEKLLAKYARGGREEAGEEGRVRHQHLREHHPRATRSKRSSKKDMLAVIFTATPRPASR